MHQRIHQSLSTLNGHQTLNYIKRNIWLIPRASLFIFRTSQGRQNGTLSRHKCCEQAQSSSDWWYLNSMDSIYSKFHFSDTFFFIYHSFIIQYLLILSDILVNYLYYPVSTYFSSTKLGFDS